MACHPELIALAASGPRPASRLAFSPLGPERWRAACRRRMMMNATGNPRAILWQRSHQADSRHRVVRSHEWHKEHVRIGIGARNGAPISATEE
ncbi:hypothetical protein BC938DRAFT_481064 [Jimgerdemannia flammicorona]|uniref:Uncharacterized protein n=1 Tax=Jimgerdemannia flammicorona TaxID=994334 RepID=A0A433QH00_9FUNG|nr:hypothetical protein BC938DRAFT_481064 [Jimgerdemannia flammicorona]